MTGRSRRPGAGGGGAAHVEPRLVKLLVSAALVVGALAAPAPAARGGAGQTRGEADAAVVRPTASAPCQVLAVSPAFATDGTAMCAHQEHRTTGTVATGLRRETTPVQVYVTTDSGRSWRRAAGEGLPGAETDHVGPTLGQLLLSPSFASDRTAWLWAGSDGLFRSRDLGATWEIARVPPASSEPTTGRLTPVPLGASVALAYAWPTSVCAHGRRAPTDALVVWPAAVPVPGAQCGSGVQYLVPAGYPAASVLLLGSVTTANRDESRMWTCLPVLDCEASTTIRPGTRPVQAWTSPDGSTIWAHLRDAASGRSLLSVSRDRGATWAPWAPAERLLPPRPLTSLSLAVTPDGKRLVLRTSTNLPRTRSQRTGGSAAGGGEERLHVSDDGGATWRAVTGRRPFNAPYGHGIDEGGIWQAGDRLLTLAETDVGRTGVESAGVWCSVDQGRTWSPRCPR